jgi:branched-chain amino acid transport system substrate-binding protein
MYPLAERSGVLMLSSSSSTPNLTEDTPLFFRNWPSDRHQAPVFADQTFNRFKRRTASVLYSRSEYGVDVQALFREAYERIGGKVIIAEAYKPKSTDFQTQIKRFLEHPADCIWLFGYYSEIGHFLKQARELGLRTQFFGQEGIEAAALLQISGEAAEGLVYFVPAFDPDAPTPNVKRFVDAFAAKTGRQPDVVAAHAYDALQILAGAIQAVGPEPQNVAEQLLKLKDYPGVAGPTAFDRNGEVRRMLTAKTIRQARFVPCAPGEQPLSP